MSRVDRALPLTGSQLNQDSPEMSHPQPPNLQMYDLTWQKDSAGVIWLEILRWGTYPDHPAGLPLRTQGP